MDSRVGSDPVAMDATYKLHADLLSAMADPRRLEILHLLGTGPRDIASLATGIGTTEADVSQELAVLCAAGIVEEEPVGQLVRYSLCDADLTVACELMRGLVRRRLGRAPGGRRHHEEIAGSRPRSPSP